MVINLAENLTLPADLEPIVWRRLQETAPRTGTQNLASLFARRRAEELAARGRSPRYIEELKTRRLGDRPLAFEEWAEAALWRIDLTMNAGDNGCLRVPQGQICWHYGTFPELTRISRGAPIDPQPNRQRCEPGSTVACLWIRRWQHAIVVVNETGSPISTAITTGQPACRHLTDVWTAEPLANGACVTSPVAVTIPALASRIYTEQP